MVKNLSDLQNIVYLRSRRPYLLRRGCASLGWVVISYLWPLSFSLSQKNVSLAVELALSFVVFSLRLCEVKLCQTVPPCFEMHVTLAMNGLEILFIFD